ncbi:hypothetical protein [Mesorhizobium sp. AR02]|uniref:hypothetical protein n=1 Tax=Mesorhizobium sp. AR02 TaxID=2865837 RepID=UPI00296235A2|nr:hypothetical protein [Mesorhizobium sp. AR02]
MRLNIPRKQYILESDLVEDAGDYYTFLEQPPVEKVQRLYSVDEVQRSARVRDIARRVDLDTLNFESGSATISDSEVKKLQGVADAMDSARVRLDSKGTSCRGGQLTLDNTSSGVGAAILPLIRPFNQLWK